MEKTLLSLLSHLCCLPFDGSALSKWLLVDSLLGQLTNNADKVTINNQEYIKTEQLLNFIYEEYSNSQKKLELEEKLKVASEKLEEILEMNVAQEEVCTTHLK